ncbi:MAG TPA: cyanophycin synthetase, partial [Candidatus Paceibacterota bacterium]|nr:cyanophycin synthetase [Candidatus Paceibacterota bacterium]
ERIEEGQGFQAVVDYAHTPDSLAALYSAYPGRKICVLGNTGGGRDTWKRPEMGRIADEACDEVILTNEDPYDEDPRAIVEAMAAGMKRAPKIIMDRREAIGAALSLARPGDAVLITGKGTDPYIMEANGKKTPWSDAAVVREELKKLAGGA